MSRRIGPNLFGSLGHSPSFNLLQLEKDDAMNATENSLLQNLKLPAMGQLGIVVGKMGPAISHYSNLLGIRPWYRAKIVESDIHYRGNPIELELDIAVGYSGGLQFELIEVIRGEDNIYTELIDSRGQGIHHIGFVVSGISERIEIFKQSGFQPLQHGTLTTRGKAITRFAYFDTLDQFGYITELIQTTLFGINVGMSRWMMKAGKLIGDVETI